MNKLSGHFCIFMAQSGGLVKGSLSWKGDVHLKIQCAFNWRGDHFIHCRTCNFFP